MNNILSFLIWTLISLHGVFLIVNVDLRNSLYNTFAQSNISSNLVKGFADPTSIEYADILRYSFAFTLLPVIFINKQKWVLHFMILSMYLAVTLVEFNFLGEFKVRKLLTLAGGMLVIACAIIDLLDTEQRLYLEELQQKREQAKQQTVERQK